MAGVVTTLAGENTGARIVDGTGTLAQFRSPHAVTVTADGSKAYVAEADDHLVRSVVVATGQDAAGLGGRASVGRELNLDTTVRLPNLRI